MIKRRNTKNRYSRNWEKATKKSGGRLLSPDKHKTLQDRRRSLPSILEWLMTRGASARSCRKAEKPRSIKARTKAPSPAQTKKTSADVFFVSHHNACLSINKTSSAISGLLTWASAPTICPLWRRSSVISEENIITGSSPKDWLDLIRFVK